jgi:hypothetical protein
MVRQCCFATIVFLGAAANVVAQNASNIAEAEAWRPAEPLTAQVPAPAHDAGKPSAKVDPAVVPAAASSPIAEPARQGKTRVTNGTGTLPNDAGQVWREYDISPYTARVTTTKRPEQAIVDWVLRETGYEAWHTEPLGILSAGPRTLRVYHTPAMQAVVADLVERFISSEAATYTFSMRVVTLDSPDWRTTGQRLLRSISTQTPGVNAWLLAKEDAAILVGELRRRSDCREHSSPYLMVNNGQATLVSAMRGRPYVRDVIPRPDTAVGFDPSPGQVDEGFNLDSSPLLTADRRMVDATVKCDIDQIEKVIPVMLDVPTRTLPAQRTKIEVPQIVHYRFHERFRWPADQVLLVGMGMVALPMPVDGSSLVPGVPLPLGNAPARADLLVFIECKGPAVPSAAATTGHFQRAAKNYRGRY